MEVTEYDVYSPTDNMSSAEDLAQFCREVPDVLVDTIWYSIYSNAVVGCVTNSLIFTCYLGFKHVDKLSTTEFFITLLSASDAMFSFFVVLLGTLGKTLPAQVFEDCLFQRIVSTVHAFAQFLSWLLYLNICFERFLCICKVSPHSYISLIQLKARKKLDFIYHN